MIKRLKQERYLGEGNNYNTLTFGSNRFTLMGTEEENLLSSDKVISIGVQAPPNTQFTINGQTITVGKTGIFEWDIENIIGSYITSFKFIHDTGHELQSTETYIVDYCYLSDPMG